MAKKSIYNTLTNVVDSVVELQLTATQNKSDLIKNNTALAKSRSTEISPCT